jgi:hypothetical protein
MPLRRHDLILLDSPAGGCWRGGVRDLDDVIIAVR